MIAAVAATRARGQDGREGDLLALAGVSTAEPYGFRGGRIGEHCCPASHLLPPSSRFRFGRRSRQRGELPRTVTSAHRTDVDQPNTEPMGKSSHRPWGYFTTLPVCRSAVSAGRWELRPIARVCGQRPAERTLGSSTGSEPEPARSVEQVHCRGCNQTLRNPKTERAGFSRASLRQSRIFCDS